MNKNVRNFYIDLGLFLLLALTILAASVEIFIPCFVHVFLGLTLSLAAVIHVALHWQWIMSTSSRFGRLPSQVRINFILNLTLFLAYSAAGTMGLIARSLIFLGPLRQIVGFFHVLLVIGLIFLQTIHLARHWKWVTVTAKRTFTQA